MKAATIQELKKELTELPPARLIELCLRLARFKKENKELLSYLLFEATDEPTYIRQVQTNIDELFADINLTQLRFAKKTLQKMVRLINKYSRFSSNTTTELELRLYFCIQLKNSAIPIHRNTVISNIYAAQQKKVHALLNELHEDLQYDYKKELKKLEL